VSNGRRLGRGLYHRLDRLVPTVHPAGCAICRTWTAVMLVGEDGPHRAEPCVGCGRLVPTRLLRRYHGIRLSDV
jgi:hypothetical protein